MKRKTSSDPTRIYSYRCLPPITEAPRVEDQLRLAHQYRNALVEVEHKLRARFRDIQLADEVLGPVLLSYEEADAGVTAALAALRCAKSGVAAPDLTAHRALLVASKAQRATVSATLRETKRARAEVLVPLYEAAREWAAAERRRTRNAYSDRGLRHGAYARVEDGVRQAAGSTKRPLVFRRYDGTGFLGTQLTETGVKTRQAVDPAALAIGMTWGELISGLDPRLRLGRPGEADPHPRDEVSACRSWEEAMRLPRNLRRHAARTYVDLRVGSQPSRAPIFARFPVRFHRLPPLDAVIKWAYVVRRRVGYHYTSHFQLTLESKTFERPAIAVGQGTCAVNLGWRRLVDDEGNVIGLRAAYVVDDQGREFEVRVPDYGDYSALSAMGKCDDLARIRDRSFDEERAALVGWLAARGEHPPQWTSPEPVRQDGSVPRNMSERLRGLAAWRSQWKLRALVDQWRQRRWPGDEEIFERLVAWAKQDRHLEAWQAHQREGIIGRRREAWRCMAVQLARTYATILVGEGRLPEIDGWNKKPPEEGDPHEGREQRRMARLAAPGELRAEILKAAAKTGAEIVPSDDRRATRRCSSCGHDEPWDAAPTLEHTCAGCGLTWDQDANYDKNLLRRHLDAGPAARSSGGVPANVGGQIDPVKLSGSLRGAGSSARTQLR